MTFRADGAEILPELVALRRALHGSPELGLHLPETQRMVLEALEGLGLEITLGEGLSSVVAVLRGGRPGPVVLLRGDMDGLPVVEENDLDYRSTNGCMHACGHDLHTAGLVGAARILAKHRDELPGSVIFMFQPAEEGPGGAKPMIEEGLLDAAGERPIAAYGIHVCPGPAGEFMLKPGPLMASANELHVRVNGRGGHGSQPHSAVDPVPALAELVTALQAMVTRRFDVFDPVVLSVTQLEAGKANNVIPDSARLGATVRTLSDASTLRFGEEAKRLADGIAAAHGCTADVVWKNEYPVTVNDDAEAARVIEVLGETFGDDRVSIVPQPLMGSEDFSFVLREVPGAFVFLAATPADVDPATAAWNHSPRVLFDDGVLGDQAAALASLAWARLDDEAGSAGAPVTAVPLDAVEGGAAEAALTA